MKRLIHFLRSSVRGRLALLMVAIAAPAVVLLMLLVWMSSRNERESVARHFVATARALSSLVDQQFGQSEALLKGLATSRDLAAGDFAAFHARARLVSDGVDHWILLTDDTGQPLVDTRVPFGTPLQRDPL